LVIFYFTNPRTDLPPPPAPQRPLPSADAMMQSSSMPAATADAHLQRHHPHSHSTPAIGVNRTKRTLFADDDDELEGGHDGNAHRSYGDDPPPYGSNGDMSRFPPSASFTSPGRDSPITARTRSIVRPRSVSEVGLMSSPSPMNKPCGPLGLSVNAYLCLIFQFVTTVCYIVMETLLPPVVDREYGFGVLANGIIWTGAAVVGVFSYLALKWLSRHGYSDTGLLFTAQVLTLVGNIFFSAYPWNGNWLPEWNPSHIPDLPKWRLGVGLCFVVLGFTQCDALSMAMYSKSLEGQDGSDDHDDDGEGSRHGRMSVADRTSTLSAVVADNDDDTPKKKKNYGHGSSMGIVLAVQALACTVGPIAGTRLCFWDHLCIILCCLTMCLL
jgi:hypothetical protein